MYFTLFKVDGEIIQFKRQPSVEKLKKLLDCSNIDSSLFGFYYNGKDHQDAEIVVDDFSVTDRKPVNRIATEGASMSEFWKNKVYRHDNGGKFILCGEVLVVTQEPLIE